MLSFTGKDFYQETRTMTPDERACYVDLLIYRQQHGDLPQDTKRLQLFCSGIDHDTVLSVLKTKFRRTQCGYTNDKLQDILTRQARVKKSFSDRGKIGQFWKKAMKLLSDEQLRKAKKATTKKELLNFLEDTKGKNSAFENLLKDFLNKKQAKLKLNYDNSQGADNQHFKARLKLSFKPSLKQSFLPAQNIDSQYFITGSKLSLTGDFQNQKNRPPFIYYNTLYNSLYSNIYSGIIDNNIYLNNNLLKKEGVKNISNIMEKEILPHGLNPKPRVAQSPDTRKIDLSPNKAPKSTKVTKCSNQEKSTPNTSLKRSYKGEGAPVTPQEDKQSPEYRFFEAYNNTCSRLPKAQILSTSRKRKIRARIKDFGEKNTFKILEIIDKSNFLCGENNRGWKANFDWILESKNFVKILEGNYQNSPKTTHNEYNNNPNNKQYGNYSTRQYNNRKVCGVTELLRGNIRIPDLP